MTKRKQATTEMAIRAAKPEAKAYKMGAGQGMYLLVNPSGSKLWRLKYRFGGKEKTLSIGAYPEVSLARARLAREEARAVLASGVDPSAAKQEEKAEQQAKALTFRAVAERWYKGNAELARKPWAKATAKKVRIYLEKDFYPAIGDMPIAEVTRQDLIDINERMEKREAFDAARKSREWLAAIFDEALDRGEIPHNPAHRLKAGPRAKGITTAPNPNVEWKGLPELLRAVEASSVHVVIKAAIRMLTLTAVRPGELRYATWAEFDLNGSTWNIPAERMKMRRPHSVPLPQQALAILEQLKAINPEGYLFSVRGSQPISPMTINVALKRLGYGGRQTGHGFRHLLSTELHQRGYNSDWIEAQLAHKTEGIRGVYNHADYLEQRRQMMQAWADSIDAAMDGANVVAFKREAAR